MRIHIVLLLSACLFCPTVEGRAQSAPATQASTGSAVRSALAAPTTPEEFFARARQLSDLEAAGIPFHVKGTYVASGNTEFTGNGTYEEWWVSKDIWRKEATLGEYKYVAIQSGGDSRIYTSSAYTPLRLRQVLDAVVIRIPSDAGASGTWKMQSKKLSGVALTVLSRKNPCATVRKKPTKEQCLQRYYFTADGILRLQTIDSATTVYNDIRPFHDLLIPRSIAIADDEQVRSLVISIDLLEPLTAGEKDVSSLASVPAGLQPAEKIVQADEATGNEQANFPRLLRLVNPIYPPAALQNKQEGKVLINAVIDEQGNVREPYVIHSAGTQLDDAALAAVHQWKYTPITFDGKPVPFETTIAVAFSLRH